MTPPLMLPAPPTSFVPASPICVAVTGASLPELLSAATACSAAGFPFAELRLDSFPPAELALPMLGNALAQLCQSLPHLQLLATCRRVVAGGGFHGTAEQELAVLLAAAHAGACIVDLAIETAEALGHPRVAAAREALHARGTLLLLSHHDFQATGDLRATAARLRPFSPDILKVVSTAHSLADNLPVLDFLAEQAAQGQSAVGIAMGEQGLLSRVLGLRAGAAWTFAAAPSLPGTAPGQPPASVLRDLYRVEQLSGSSGIYAVAGDPISHSLSPLMHSAAFRAAGIDAVYLPLLCADAHDLMRVARALPLDGISVTMPLKESILPLLDGVDPAAARIGAVNTLHRTPEGRWHGYNTDAEGVVAPLAARIPLRSARVLVLGAGGAARAAVFALCEQGAEVSIWNRTPARAVALAQEAGASVADASMLTGHGFDVLLNAVPAGMGGLSDAAASQLSHLGAPLGARLIFEMIYYPRLTPLVLQARAQGLQVITGDAMFVHQGARQFERWTGRQAPQAAMAAVVEEALCAREQDVDGSDSGAAAILPAASFGHAHHASQGRKGKQNGET